MLKDFFGILKDWDFPTIVYGAGIAALILFGLSLVPSLAWIPKFFVFWFLTH